MNLFQLLNMIEAIGNFPNVSNFMQISMKYLYITLIWMKLIHKKWTKLFEVPQKWIKLFEVTHNWMKLFHLAQMWMKISDIAMRPELI